MTRYIQKAAHIAGAMFIVCFIVTFWVSIIGLGASCKTTDIPPAAQSIIGKVTSAATTPTTTTTTTQPAELIVISGGGSTSKPIDRTINYQTVPLQVDGVDTLVPAAMGGGWTTPDVPGPGQQVPKSGFWMLSDGRQISAVLQGGYIGLSMPATAVGKPLILMLKDAGGYTYKYTIADPTIQQAYIRPSI